VLLAFHAHLSYLLGSVDLSLSDCPKNRNRRTLEEPSILGTME